MKDTIYRAKKIGSDEWVEGDYFSPNTSLYFILKKRCGFLNGDDLTIMKGEFIEIDHKTLSIHFTNSSMHDRDDTPIFASLSSDGNGGDSIKIEDSLFVAKLHLLIPSLEDKFGERRAILVWNKYSKVTGIHTAKDE